MVRSLGVADAGRRRKIYEQRDRAELVASVKRGELVPIVARRVGVTRSTAYRWIREANDVRVAVAQPTFIELVTSGSAGTGTGLVVRVGVAEIEVRFGFDAGLLRAVVAALDGGAP